MRIYFMGICGAGMGQAALLMQSAGHTVCGSDQNAYPPMSTLLAEAGVEVYAGWDAQRLQQLAPDLVVVGNAVTRGHPEVEYVLGSGLAYTSLPALLGEYVLKGRQNIVVCGTHGKTTTSAMTAYLLSQAQPTACGWFIGGAPRDLPSGSHLGEANMPFVIEGDEYDSAFFDKRSKFIHYRPRICVLNNLEFDHADIFRDLLDIQRSFRHLTRILPPNGVIIANGDDENLQPILKEVTWCKVVTFGQKPTVDYQITEYQEDARGASFTLANGAEKEAITLGVGGLYNAFNATAALLAVKHTAVAGSRVSELRTFQGVKRRQEAHYVDEQRILMEDFAHHPTALRGTLQSLRARYPQHRLVAAFEPRSNTACSAVFEEAFTEALSLADAVRLAPVYRGERIPAERRLDTARMARNLRATGIDAQAYAIFEQLEASLRDALATEEKTLVALFSNGAFGGIVSRLTAYLVAHADP